MIYEGIQGASIELLDDLLVIRRKGVMSALSHGLKGDKRIPYASITSVQFKEPGLMSGYIQFGVAGGREGRGGVFEATKDENSVMFVKKTADQMRQVRDIVEQRAAAARNGGSRPPEAAAKLDLVGELTRLAELRDKGILTNDEFDRLKGDLLR